MIITKQVNYRGKIISVDELKPNSSIKIEVKCPNCSETRTAAYSRLSKNGHHFCQPCALKIKQSKPLEKGQTFGRWTILGEGNRSGFSFVQCTCGNEREVNNDSLKRGLSKSCGCITVERNQAERIDILPGTKFGRLIVAKPSSASGFSVCDCACGNTTTVSNGNLLRGHSRSCGCLQSEVSSELAIKRNAGKSADKHWNWQGGISTERQLAASKRKYKDWRNFVLSRDGYKCRKCGSEENLNVHHIHSYSKHPEKVYDADNGITLCETCHRKFHKIYGFNTNKDQLKEFMK